MMENSTATATNMITTTAQTFTEATDTTNDDDQAAPRERTFELPAATAERAEMQAWRLTAEIRGALNALGLCVRVLETAPTDAEAREYIRHIATVTQRLERLIAKRHMARSA